MNPTDELISLLSKQPPQLARWSATAVVGGATALSLVAAVVLSMAWLYPRADLASALASQDHAVLLKLAFTLGIAAAALPIVRDLSMPGHRPGWNSVLIAVPFVVIAILAVHELGRAPPGLLSHLDHASWLACVWQIPALSLPAFILLMAAVRRLAPTNLSPTGAYVGLAAGGIGGTAYALHCHDDSFVFVAVAYTIAIAEMAVLGAFVGPKVLRWR